MELARQAKDRKARQHGGNKEIRRHPCIGDEHLPDVGIGQCTSVDIDKTVKHAVNDKEAHHQKGGELDQAFERHRQNKAVMVFGRVDIAHTKQD